MNILELARSVKRGVKLLDKKVPDWRKVLRKHADQFDLADGDHCILGTLEHYSGRLQVLNARKVKEYADADFERGVARLNLDDHTADEHGFNTEGDEWDTYDQRIEVLGDLWRAEFE